MSYTVLGGAMSRKRARDTGKSSIREDDEDEEEVSEVEEEEEDSNLSEEVSADNAPETAR